MNFIETTNQKPTIVAQKLKRKEHKHTTKENHQITRGETKEEEYREEVQKQPENK